MNELRIGISGWRYAMWRGKFYPKGLAQRRELEFASQKMNSVEINGSFYSLQTPASYKRWHDETPDDFVFAVKGSKYITHVKKLSNIRVPLANFFASGLLVLGKKLGPILWQFPRWQQHDAEKFEAFLKLLPRTTRAAARLAAENTIKSAEKRWIKASVNVELRYAFEMRHESFFSSEFIEVLRRHNAALVFADTAGTWPYAEDLTSDIVYIRLHGAEVLYKSGYTDDQLRWWASRIRLWRAGRQPGNAKLAGARFSDRRKRSVYVYFDNDIDVHAPFDAIRLAEMLSRR